MHTTYIFPPFETTFTALWASRDHRVLVLSVFRYVRRHFMSFFSDVTGPTTCGPSLILHNHLHNSTWDVLFFAWCTHCNLFVSQECCHFVYFGTSRVTWFLKWSVLVLQLSHQHPNFSYMKPVLSDSRTLCSIIMSLLIWIVSPTCDVFHLDGYIFVT